MGYLFNDIYVAGSGGYIGHFNGAEWKGVTSNTSKTLVSIHGSSAINIIAVGLQGAIVHNKGAGLLLRRIREVWLEQVGTRPGEGAVGAFSFGRGYGLLRGVCAANFLTIIDVTPATWKAAMKVRGDKDESRARASALFPRHGQLWPLKHDGRAEAVLIAAHGMRQLHSIERTAA